MVDEAPKEEKLDYTSKAEETDFISLVEDDEFKKDLVRFFSGGRYKMTPDEMRKKGFEGLTKDFIEHMRGQSWNEVTAMKDYNYVNNKDMDERGKQAFGRLMKAWDSSEAAGTGFFDGVGDFAEAVLSAPSTYAGAASFGIGKIGSKAAGKATQVLLRRSLADVLKKNAASNSMARAIGSSAAIGAVGGAVESGAMSALQGETREKVIGGYEYGVKDVIADAAIGGAFGGALGGISGAVGGKRAKTVDEVLTQRSKAFSAEAEEAAKKSLGTISKADAKVRQEAVKIVADIEDVLSANAGVKGAKLKDKLDPERVAKGTAMLNAMSDPKAAPEFSSGLSVTTMRNIAAAAIDMMDELKIKDSERITETVANALRDGDVAGFADKLTAIRKKYGLSKDEFSLIYLAEASRAGQILGFQSAIKRGAKLSEMNDINVLFTKGASSLSDEDMQKIAAQAIKNSNNKGMNFLQDLDAMRISFMTSQPATTLRNMRNAGILIATDMVDEVNKALYKGLFKGDTKAIKDFIPNMTAMVRGYTFNNSEAKIVRNLMLEEMPEQAKRLYQHAMRADVALEGASPLAKAGRFVNLLNTASDSVLKEGMFYGSLDRQFRDQGLDMGKWLRSNKKLEDLPSGISVDRAIDDANRLTMQRDFRGDTSAIGRATKGLSNLNRKLPFVVSGAMGVPFPRYLGNHLNMVAEYIPLVGELGYRTGIVSGAEDAATRIARQTTGLYGLAAGYVLAEMRGGEVDYGSIKNELGAQEDMKPYMGAALFHIWAGDRAWRIEEGLPVTEGKALGQELKDVLGGIPDFSFDFGIIEGLAEVAMTGEVSEKFEKSLGGFLSTFTMPAAIARDVIGQMSYDQAGAPFTRDLAITDGVSTKGAGLNLDTVTMQSTRMLPDMQFMQYTQSFNGETDIDYYRFSNPVAIGKMNPLTKQITGATSEPPLTELEKEMNKANLKDWQLYNSKTVPNANIDYVLRQRLAKNLPKEFAKWKANAPAGRAYPNMTYDDIKDPKEKAQLLEGWIKKRIDQEKEVVESMFDKFVAANPYKARGYIRNNYALKRKKLGAEVFDKAAKQFGYSSADDYISDAESINQEIERRMKILMMSSNYIEVEPH